VQLDCTNPTLKFRNSYLLSTQHAIGISNHQPEIPLSVEFLISMRVWRYLRQKAVYIIHSTVNGKEAYAVVALH